MQINQMSQLNNQSVKNEKVADKDKAQGKSAEVSQQDKIEKYNFTANHKLMIGAKSLMSALNRELKLESSYSFSARFEGVSNDKNTKLNKIEPLTFDFEEVAKNVMEFVSSVIQGAKSGGADDEKLKELLAQAREGIDKGFAMARKELGDMDMLSDDTKAGIGKSYELIQEGLENLTNDIFDLAPAQIAANSRQVNMLEQEQGSISIKTRDGDSIEISFASSASLSLSQSNNDGQSSRTLDINSSQSFSFKVEGNLDEQELAAVGQLVQDIGELADNFFNGNIEKAWQQATELGFDQSQIAEFSLDFQEVKQISVKDHYSNSSAKSPIATIAPYLKDLNSVVERADSLLDGDNLKQLMHDIADKQMAAIDELTSSAGQLFSNFNQQLLDAQD